MGFSLLGGLVRVSPPLAKNLLISPSWKTPPQSTPPSKVLILTLPPPSPHIHWRLIHPSLNISFHVKPNKSFIFSCSHCSCAMYTQVMLILVLISVHYCIYRMLFLIWKRFKWSNALLRFEIPSKKSLPLANLSLL